MVEPDHSNHDNNSDDTVWKNWLVINIRGDNILTGQILSEYVPPRPDINTGR